MYVDVHKIRYNDDKTTRRIMNKNGLKLKCSRNVSLEGTIEETKRPKRKPNYTYDLERSFVFIDHHDTDIFSIKLQNIKP